MADRDDLRRIREQGTRRSVVISILVSAAALALVFAFVPDRGRAFQALRGFSRERLGVCALLMVGAWISDALRLYLLTRGVRKPVNPLVALKGILAGNFLTLITPFLAGGAPAVAYAIKRGGLSWGEATAVVVGGGIVAQSALVCLAISAMGVLSGMRVEVMWGNLFRVVVPAYAAGLVAFSVLALRADVVEQWLKGITQDRRRPRLAAVGRKFVRNLKDFQKSLAALARENLPCVAGAFAAAMGYFILVFAIGPVALKGLGVDQPWAIVFSLEVLVYVLAGITPTPGGSGTAELGTFVLLSHVAASHTIGAFLVIWRLFTFYFSLLSGGVAFAMVLRDMLSDS